MFAGALDQLTAPRRDERHRMWGHYAGQHAAGVPARVIHPPRPHPCLSQAHLTSTVIKSRFTYHVLAAAEAGCNKPPIPRSTVML